MIDFDTKFGDESKIRVMGRGDTHDFASRISSGVLGVRRVHRKTTGYGKCSLIRF
jgi:hypothetical protein